MTVDHCSMAGAPAPAPHDWSYLDDPTNPRCRKCCQTFANLSLDHLAKRIARIEEHLGLKS